MNLTLDESLEVRDPKAAQVLTDLSRLRFLIPFITSELTLSEAAERLGLKLNTMHYHVRRLIALGLLEIVREEPRRGRAIKIYRATSPDYFVPFEATSTETLEELVAGLQRRTDDIFRKNLVRTYLEEVEGVGIRVQRSSEGKVVIQVDTPARRLSAQPEPERMTEPAVEMRDTTLKLEFEEAKALQRDLDALLEKYNGQPHGQSYLLRIGLTPLRASLLREES